MANGFNTNALEELRKAMDQVNREATKKTKKFMQKEGNKLKKETVNVAEQKIKKKTGNYIKSIKRGKIYQYGDKDNFAVRVYSSAPHAHLIEQGHDMVSHKPEKNFLGKVQEFLVLDDARRNFQDTFNKDLDEFLDELVKGL